MGVLPAVLSALLAVPARALPPEAADKKVLEGLEAAYSFDFAAASAAFMEADRLAPDHPVAPFFLASLTWLEFSQDADLPETRAALEPRFEALIAETCRRAEARLERDPDDAEARFYLGAAYGTRGRWQLVKRQWLRAAASGYKGYKQLKRAVQLDPGLYDAYLGLGMYDYYADKLPTVIKFASWFIARGDKERGLRYVRLAGEKGHYSRVEARLFLAGLYAGYEKDGPRALEIVSELRRERPDNLFFAFVELITRLDAKDWGGAAALGEQLEPRVRATPAAASHIALFDLYLGEAYLGGKVYEKAASVFSRCIEESPDPRRASVTFCRLRRAQAFDLLGWRRQAVEDYAAVKDSPDFFDSQDKARKGFKTPATWERVVAELEE